MLRPDAIVVHALPRRVHVRAGRLAGHRGACERIAAALARDPAIERVSVRERTGSVIVESERRLDPGEIARRVSELCAAERDEDGRPLTEERPYRDGPTRVAAAVAASMAAINADVSDALDGEADLGTLLPVGLALGGIVEIVTTGKIPMPPWFNLVWWSLRSFMTFNAPAEHPESTDALSASRQPLPGEARVLQPNAIPEKT